MQKGEASTSAVLSVPRTKEEAKRFYDRVSRFYDYLTAAFEQRHAQRARQLLFIEHGETVLEIGFGTGRCLQRIAEQVGQTGKVFRLKLEEEVLPFLRS